MKKVYFAAPLFTPQERAFNSRLTSMLEQSFEVFLPQRDGVLIPGQSISQSEFSTLSTTAFTSDLRAIANCDYLFAVLDGRTIDEGVSFELGYAFALGKVCIGFRTDTRVLLPHGNNPMIECCLTTHIQSEDALHSWIVSLHNYKV